MQRYTPFVIVIFDIIPLNQRGHQRLFADHGKNNMGRVIGTMVNNLLCRGHCCIRCEILTGIQIPVEPGKITARDLNTDPVSFHEYI